MSRQNQFMKEAVPLLGGSPAGDGLPRSGISGLIDAFSVTDKRFYNEDSLSLQLWLLIFFELLFMLTLIFATVECVPMHAMITSKGALVPYNTSQVLNITHFDREFINAGCESEIKDRSGYALSATLLYLILMSVLLPRSAKHIKSINLLIANALRQGTPEARTEGTFLRDLERACKGLMRFKTGCIIFFALCASATTGWVIWLGFTRTRPMVCGYSSNWQAIIPGPGLNEKRTDDNPRQAFRCLFWNTLLLKGALTLVFLFRCLLFLSLVFSVRSLSRFLKKRPWTVDPPGTPIGAIGEIISKSSEFVKHGSTIIDRVQVGFKTLTGQMESNEFIRRAVQDTLRSRGAVMDEGAITEAVAAGVKSALELAFADQGGADKSV